MSTAEDRGISAQFDSLGDDQVDQEDEDKSNELGSLTVEPENVSRWISAAIELLEDGNHARASECYGHAQSLEMTDGDDVKGVNRELHNSYALALYKYATQWRDDGIDAALIQDCERLFWKTRSWLMVALCDRTLGESVEVVLQSIEAALLDDQCLSFDEVIFGSESFEREFEDVTDLRTLSVFWEVELQDQVEAARVLTLHHRERLRRVIADGSKTVAPVEKSDRNLLDASTASSIAQLKRESRKKEAADLKKKERARRLAWMRQAQVIFESALSGALHCYFDSVEDPRRMDDLGFEISEVRFDKAREAYLAEEYEKLLRLVGEHCDAVWEILHKGVGQEVQLKVFLTEAKSQFETICAKSEAEFLNRFRFWFLTKYRTHISLGLPSKGLLDLLEEHTTMLLVVQDKLENVVATNCLFTSSHAFKHRISWSKGGGESSLQTKDLSAQKMKWWATGGQVTLNYVLGEILDEAEDGNDFKIFHLSCTKPDWIIGEVFEGLDDDGLFVDACHPYLLNEMLMQLGYETIFISKSTYESSGFDFTRDISNPAPEADTNEVAFYVRVAWGSMPDVVMRKRKL